VILCTIPVNLKDSAPFGSLHASALDAEGLEKWDALYKTGVSEEAEGNCAAALRAYEEASRIDAAYADLAFRLGRCSLALGKNLEARQHFLRARDLDTLPFRSDATTNATIRDVAAGNAPDVALADAERVFDESSALGVPGEDFFLEHVHMNFKGNYLLARTLLETITKVAPRRLGQGAGDAAAPLSEQECAARLAQTEWNEWKFGTRIHEQLIQGPPFTSQLDHVERSKRWKDKLAAMHTRLQAGGLKKAVAEYQRAIQTAASDSMIRVNFGDLLSEIGSLAEAKEQFEEALAHLRHDVAAHRKAGTVDLKMGSPITAESHFREALRTASDDAETHIGLAEALEGQGRNAEALAIYEEQMRRAPTRAYAPAALGRFLFRSGKLEEARAQFSEALRREPNKAAIHVDLGTTALKEGNVDEAIEHFEDALRLQPEWPELRAHLAEVREKHSPGKAKNRN